MTTVPIHGSNINQQLGFASADLPASVTGQLSELLGSIDDINSCQGVSEMHDINTSLLLEVLCVLASLADLTLTLYRAE